MATVRDRNLPKSTAQRRYVSERRLSEITGRSVRTLQKDRLLGNGPFPFYRCGRQIAYDLDECIGIIEATRVGGTAA
jgi:hypothetical protein